ncbi:cysteine desulfurase family protein [Altericista sp. CCNU0014]|uniref:cysteine desulfurase family protein n=1 Tax=Altericista sp. CCNU0014 TaxID=3082949 RepID=UPI00384B8DDE
MQVYLDYSATTPCRPEAIAALTESLAQGWGNPSSLHEWGKRAAFAVEQARWQVAQLVNAPSADAMVFTSGGTESNNLALLGVARTFSQPQHLIISSVEHPAIAQTAAILEQQGWQVTSLPVNAYGRVNPEDLRAALQPNTVLVSIIYGQSEVGTLQPIEALGTIAQSVGALFHTDAVQVAGRVPLDVEALPVDLMSLSSHKIYGPQGIGALYIKPGTAIQAMGGGGGQERGLRSGTPAVALISAFGVAADCALKEIETEPERLRGLRDRLLTQLQDLTVLKLTGDPHHRLPHHASFCLMTAQPVSGRELVKQMNAAGIGVSAGSACHSGKLQPSPILTAMGYESTLAQSGLRMTLGQATTLEDIDWVAEVLRQIVTRSMSKTVSRV